VLTKSCDFLQPFYNKYVTRPRMVTFEYILIQKCDHNVLLTEKVAKVALTFYYDLCSQIIIFLFKKMTTFYKKLRLASMVIKMKLFGLILLLIFKIWNLNIFSKSFFENPFLDIFVFLKNVQISKSQKVLKKM